MNKIRIISAILTALSVIILSSCGAVKAEPEEFEEAVTEWEKTEAETEKMMPEEAESEEEESDEVNTDEEEFTEVIAEEEPETVFIATDTVEYKADLNGDGKEETLRFDLGENRNGTLGGVKIGYYSADGTELDTFDLNKIYYSYSQQLEVFNNHWLANEDNEYINQIIRAYINDKGYISLNYYLSFQGKACEYIIFEIRDNKINVLEHLKDPGYTAGHGLFKAETYYSPGEFLFEEEPGSFNGEPVNKYDPQRSKNTYLSALNEEMAPYGYTFENDDFNKDGDIRGYVIETNGVKTVLNKTYPIK